VHVVKLLMNLLLTPISDLGRNNCDDNGSERVKGLFSLFNTHMFNLLLGVGDEKKFMY